MDNNDTINDKKEEEEEYIIGNFSDFDEEGGDDACGGDNKYKKEKKSKCKTNKCATKCKDTDCGDEKTKNAVSSAESKPAKSGDLKKLCSKCKELLATLKYRNDPCCRACYLGILDHKFRAGLRTSVKIWKEDLILVCVSGGQNSIALAKMVNECLFNPSQRKMFFKAQLFHINESAIYNFNEKQEQANLEIIKNLAKNLNFELNLINIEDIFEIANDKLQASILTPYNIDLKDIEKKAEGSPKPSSSENRKKLQLMLENLSEQGSSKEDVLLHFKTWLINHYAIKQSFKKIFVGDTAQKIATKSLASLCKGRGVNLFSDIAVQDQKVQGIDLMRPMHDFLTKEVMLYNHLHKMAPHFLLNPSIADSNNVSKSIPENGSMDRVLEKFVEKLQNGFPATVHTILNTLDKIKPRTVHTQICPLCLGKRDKISNVLEKGSVIDYLKVKEEEIVTASTIESEKKVIDLEEEDRKMKMIYLQSEFYKNKSSVEKVCCFACGRITENAKNQKVMSELLPGVIGGNAEILNNLMNNITGDKAIIDNAFY
jgi:cytoplasmic tRNA 2-thiolation protein 2